MSANDRNSFCCRTTPFHPEVADGVDSYLTTRFCKTTISPASSNPTPWTPTNPPSAGFVCSTTGEKWDFLVCKGPNGLRQNLEQPMVIFFPTPNPPYRNQSNRPRESHRRQGHQRLRRRGHEGLRGLGLRLAGGALGNVTVAGRVANRPLGEAILEVRESQRTERAVS